MIVGLLFCSLLWITSAFNNIPIQIDKCKKGQWFVRNYIVFTCLSSNARRELKPFACDPNNGAFPKTRRRPVFLQETYKGKGFIYECAVDKHTGGVVWRAVACYVNDEKFGPGTFVKGRYDSVYLCYRDTDSILRIRIRKPIHDHCIAGTGDPNCQQGILQGIWNSDFGMGDGIAYDNVSNKPLDRSSHTAQTDPTKAPIYEYPKFAEYDLLRSIKGHVNPNEVTLAPEPLLQPGDLIL
ncbi:hypothetical protein OESDEN_01974 [Oesophagostomum dentatum]|uniref:Uncharacterized protein n=1 Tax=Oesophagostomum dentatum TaxID=61180 RepID=A0A0B1TPJ9_OESDE|nr:hypothetical protein OESDEN_01974 [Oesophagostomum dentatum]